MAGQLAFSQLLGGQLQVLPKSLFTKNAMFTIMVK